MQFFTALLLPPASLYLLFLLGAVLLWRHPRSGKMLMAGSFVALWVLSTPLVSNWLLHQLDGGYSRPSADLSRAQAIVILSAGRHVDSRDYGGDSVDAFTLERLRYGAQVQRQTGLPVAVTGGAPAGRGESMAALMTRALKDFNVPVKWQEPAARDTAENAALTAAMLAPAQVNTIVLVTHGWHMQRAQRAFERAGFRVIPAATGLHHDLRVNAHNLRPGAAALRDSELFFHEFIGLAWYALRAAGQ